MMGTLAEDLQSLTLADQEYLLNNWTSRLAEVAQNDLNHQIALTDDIEDLHWLMTQPDWMQAHIANKGHYNNFLRDIRVAWDVAKKAAVLRPEMIGRQVRYALLQTSINSLASNMEPEVLIAGLRLGRWDAQTALVYAQEMTDTRSRVAALTQLGTFLHEQQEEDRACEAFTPALAGLRDIEDPSNYVEALLALAPHIALNLLATALAATQEIADAKERARVLGALAVRLPSDLFFEALEMVRGIEDSETRAMALAGLAPYIPQSLMQDALEIVQEGYNAKAKARALTALVPHLSPELIPEALLIAQTIYDECYRTVALMAFSQYWEPEERRAVLRKALIEARNAHDIKDRADGVAMLAPYLPSELLADALAEARTIGDGEPYDAIYRTRTLVALAPHLSEELQAKLIAEVRSWPVFPGFFFHFRIDILAALAPRLSQNLILQALDLVTARDIMNRGDTSSKRKSPMANEYPAYQIPKALASLAPYLPPDLISAALTNVKEIPVGDARADALIALAPYLPEDLLSDALEIARKIDTSLANYRAAALTALARRGIATALDEALKAAQQVQEADESIIALPALLAAGVMLSSPEQRPQFMDEALKAAREIGDVRYRTEALIALLGCHPPSKTLVDEALAVAREIETPEERFQVLCKLVPYLSTERRPSIVNEILEAARNVDFGAEEQNSIVTQALLLPLLASYLSPQIHKQALKAARSVYDPAIRGRALATLAPHLLHKQRAKILREAIEAAHEINPEDTGRVGVLTLVVPHLPVDQRPAVLAEIFAKALEVDRMYRPALGPALAELVPYVPSELRPAALELARELWSPHALVALVPQVPSEDRQDLLDEALAAVRGIAQPAERARLLAMALPLVQVERRLDVLQETLAAVQEISFPANLTDLLSIFLLLTAVWTELPQQQALALWPSTVQAYATQRRTYFLTVLIGLMPVIKALGGDDAISETMNAVLEICRQWSWI